MSICTFRTSFTSVWFPLHQKVQLLLLLPHDEMNQTVICKSTVKTNMNYTLMARPLISTSCSSIHQRLLSSPCVYCIRKRALVSFHCGAADGWGMISGGDKPLWGNTAANRPSTTAKHPVSRRQAHTESHWKALFWHRISEGSKYIHICSSHAQVAPDGEHRAQWSESILPDFSNTRCCRELAEKIDITPVSLNFVYLIKQANTWNVIGGTWKSFIQSI